MIMPSLGRPAKKTGVAMRVPVLEGRNIILRPITAGDTANLVKWRNSPHVRSMLFTQEELTPEQHEKWLHSKVYAGECVQFIIVAKKGQVAVGTVFLKNIDQAAGRAEFGIFIGEPAYLGFGLGGEATAGIIGYGFDVLGLREIYLSVLEDNPAAVGIYKKNGFRETGRDARGYERGGLYYPVLTMSVSSGVL